MTVSATLATGSQPQHLRALENANRVRLARAELKRRVGDDAISAADVIEGNPWEARTMTLAELLVSQRRWGRTRSRKFLTSQAVSETKAVGKLTDRQRRQLAKSLRGGGNARQPADTHVGVLQLA